VTVNYGNDRVFGSADDHMDAVLKWNHYAAFLRERLPELGPRMRTWQTGADLPGLK
jgi:hypothetical protein